MFGNSEQIKLILAQQALLTEKVAKQTATIEVALEAIIKLERLLIPPELEYSTAPSPFSDKQVKDMKSTLKKLKTAQIDNMKSVI